MMREIVRPSDICLKNKVVEYHGLKKLDRLSQPDQDAKSSN